MEFLRGIVESEARLVSAERVVLLGLSQGCAVGVLLWIALFGQRNLTLTSGPWTGLLTLLSRGQRVGAYVGFNGWMPLKAQIAQCHVPRDLAELFGEKLGLEIPLAADRSSVLGTPVLLCHTTDDEVIDIELGRQACGVLKNLGMNVTWKEQKDGGHLDILRTSGLDTIVGFLRETLNIQPASGILDVRVDP